MFRATIGEYYKKAKQEHHRYRSWEHCYTQFGTIHRTCRSVERDSAAIHLAFYLASWGMYRGSSFLLQHDYTVHRDIVYLAMDPRFLKLRRCDFGRSRSHEKLIPEVVQLTRDIEAVYRRFTPLEVTRQPTATLVSKVMLGVFGCLPACDRYFRIGWKSQNHKYSSVNSDFIAELIGFCQENKVGLRREQARIRQRCGIRYPLMKLIDMHFWQLGYNEKQKGGKRRAGRRRALRSRGARNVDRQ